MTHMYITVTVLSWAGFWIYWFINNSNQKQTQHLPNSKETLAYRILWMLAFVFLIFPLPFLSLQLWPTSMILGILGDTISVLGLVICILARRELAGNWSMQLDVKKDHELITTGPYALVRHPIYTGFLLLFLGTAIAVGTVGGCIGFVILLIGCWIRIQNEEKLMTATFGKKYEGYKKHVKALIPYIW